MIDCIWKIIVIIFYQVILTTPWLILLLISITRNKVKLIKYYLYIECVVSLVLFCLLINY